MSVEFNARRGATAQKTTVENAAMARPATTRRTDRPEVLIALPLPPEDNRTPVDASPGPTPIAASGLAKQSSAATTSLAS